MQQLSTSVIALLCITAQLISETLALKAAAPALKAAAPTLKAAAPAPPGPPNITAVLEKGGHFGTLMRLLKSTHVGDQINNQLNSSVNGITVFAPTDNAFSSLPPGTMNSLTDQQKVALIQFHELPYLVLLPQFQTISNPVRTQAGDVNNGRYPLNVTTSENQVNLTTGIVNTTIASTVYSDGQLAVYEVDKVLLPLEIFGPPAPAAAPAPVKSKRKGSSIAESPSNVADTSAAVDLIKNTSGYILLAAAAVSLWWRF